MTDSSIYISSAILLGFLTLAFFGYMAFLRYLRHKEYFGMNERKFSAQRYSIEDQIAELTDRLVRQEQRWKDVNHLLVASQERNPSALDQPSAKPHSFLEAYGIDPGRQALELRLVFVLTPFHPREDKTFRAIRDVCQDVGLQCARGDEDAPVGEIFSAILRYMSRARLIIANINGRNPNVFYELGLAHALNKDVILIASVKESTSEIPFDLRTKNILLYDDIPELQSKLHKALLRVFATT